MGTLTVMYDMFSYCSMDHTTLRKSIVWGVFMFVLAMGSFAVYKHVDNIIYVPLLSLLGKSLIEQVIYNTANNYKIFLDVLLSGLMIVAMTKENSYNAIGYVSLLGLVCYTAHGMFFSSIDHLEEKERSTLSDASIGVLVITAVLLAIGLYKTEANFFDVSVWMRDLMNYVKNYTTANRG